MYFPQIGKWKLELSMRPLISFSFKSSFTGEKRWTVSISVGSKFFFFFLVGLLNLYGMLLISVFKKGEKEQGLKLRCIPCVIKRNICSIKKYDCYSIKKNTIATKTWEATKRISIIKGKRRNPRVREREGKKDEERKTKKVGKY